MVDRPVGESSWSGLIAGQRERPAALTIRMLLQPTRAGVAGAFQAAGSDGRRWWVKPPHQGSLDRALVTEFIVGQAGRMIGAPTCDSGLIEITREFEGWEFRPGKRLRVGYAHATVEVPAAVEERGRLRYRTKDDNSTREVGIYALHDWCWGSDLQWLHSTTQDMTIYSHDHGWYFPPSGADWDIEAMRAAVDEPHPMTQSPAGLRYGAVETVAQELEKVERGRLAAMLRGVPGEWPVTDAELETLGWFLERRASAVAARLRNLRTDGE